MREILPSPPVVYAVVSLLLLMLVTASISVYFNARNNAASHRMLFWSKIILSVPMLLLGARLTVFVAAAFGILFLVGDSTSLNLKFLLLTLAPVVIYVLSVLILVRWIRNRRNANVTVIIAIITLIGCLYVFQRPWLCWPLAHLGVGSEQNCTTQHERQLQRLPRRN